ncbi:unnamed protein product [Dovyalis caffra]|uniref:Uncharacterized protein n=1 Tax=Dovyalis caffra TaxID=77055 RepID=A0AAV1QTC4_9ROSI|nr:unnamed protein product [Dovyalis caffra]
MRMAIGSQDDDLRLRYQFRRDEEARKAYESRHKKAGEQTERKKEGTYDKMVQDNR